MRCGSQLLTPLFSCFVHAFQHFYGTVLSAGTTNGASAEATASMSLDDPVPETPDAPAPSNANTPLDLKNDEVLELMLPVTADDLRPPPVARSTRPARNHLLRCLGELHVVFTRMELVWSKVEVSLDAVLKRSEALEVLLGFADTPALKGRLDVRLAKFKAFWSGLAEWDLDVAVPGVMMK